MVGSTSYAALDLDWDALDATVVLGQDIIQPELRTLPTPNAPHPAPSIHASRETDHQPARGLPVSSSVFRPDSTIIQPWPETDSAVMGAPSSWSCTTRSRQ